LVIWNYLVEIERLAKTQGRRLDLLTIRPPSDH